MHVEPLRDRAHGRWRAILPALGLKSEFLTGKNTPCPFCGGKDRWRFINRDGSGNWICNQCGKGDGLALAMRVVGRDFAETAKIVERALGEVRDTPEPTRAEISLEELKRIWEGAEPLAGTPGELYFRNRSLKLPRYLRFAWGKAIIAKIAGPDGKCTNLYRIFVTEEGKKAPIEKPKLAMRRKTPPGSAIRLFPVARTLGIAEGIENALSVFQMFGTPTWATCGTEFLTAFKVPDGVEELIIYADNDQSYAGQRAAYALANRVAVQDKIRVLVEVPSKPGVDWNDILLGVA